MAAPSRPRGIADMGAGHLEAEIGRQHAPGREHRGHPRHDHAAEIELARDVGDVQAGGAAERQQREAAGIDAAPHRHERGCPPPCWC